jgi:hypothetical protein
MNGGLVSDLHNTLIRRWIVDMVQHEMRYIAARNAQSITQEAIHAPAVFPRRRFVGEPGRPDDGPIRLALPDHPFP